MDGALIIAVLFAALLLLLIAAHNGLASLRQDVRDAWGAMDAELRRRYDLLPGLVAAARAAGPTIPAALAAAMTAKNRAAVAFSPHQLADAEAALSAHLRDLFAQPPASLAGVPAFARSRSVLLAAQLRVDDASRRYNAAVEDYNAALGSFPHDVVAAAFGFKPQPTVNLQGAP